MSRALYSGTDARHLRRRIIDPVREIPPRTAGIKGDSISADPKRDGDLRLGPT